MRKNFPASNARALAMNFCLWFTTSKDIFEQWVYPSFDIFEKQACNAQDILLFGRGRGWGCPRTLRGGRSRGRGGAPPPPRWRGKCSTGSDPNQGDTEKSIKSVPLNKSLAVNKFYMYTCYILLSQKNKQRQFIILSKFSWRNILFLDAQHLM